MRYLYVATMLSHICQFHLPYFKMLQERGNQIDVAAFDNLAVKNGLELKYADRFMNVPFVRSPINKQNIKAYRELKNIIDTNQYDVIVCNTPVGGVLTRMAANKYRNQGTKVIYIAHGFHFYKGASLSNWMLYYPLEKAMAKLCDAVVTINEEDYLFAKEHFPVEVKHIHGIGVSDERYHPANEQQRLQMLMKEGIENNDFVILCTGELNDNKNQKSLISAVSLLKETISDIKVLLAGNGPNEQSLKEQIINEHLEDHVFLLGYRTDLENLLPAVDLVVSCSKREGLGLNVIEAMLCKKPIVASINRGHTELIDDGVNGYLVAAEQPEAYAEAIRKIYKNKTLAIKMGELGFQKAKKYTVSEVAKELETIFADVTGNRF